jgi:hypothetical protein
MASEIDPDDLAAILVRGMHPAIQEEFLASPEWREMPAEVRDRIAEADARISERERKRGPLTPNT